MIHRIEDYVSKLSILRQIMSNKARFFGWINTAVSVATIVVSSAVTFIGFWGPEKLKKYFNFGAENITVELAFNLLVLAFFVLMLLYLVFRFGEKETAGSRAVVLLTQLINEIGDQISRTQQGHTLTFADVDLVRHKCNSLIATIPSNTDGEFLKAKADFRSKQLKSASLGVGAQALFDDSGHERIFTSMLMRTELVMSCLSAMREIDSGLYLGGGVVRNVVWDFLHGYRSPTPIDDVDVVYYDPLSCTKAHEEAIEAKRKAKLPNLKWSVKNQARMHLANGDDACTSISDAIGKWPETATAIVVRLTQSGEVEAIAPHGYSDLFRLIVAPTPHFRSRAERYKSRIADKKMERAMAEIEG